MPQSTHIGPYRILRRINQGGQGSLYLGYDTRLFRQVAIKIVSIPSRRRARQALLREARLVASIQSPRVVQVYDVVTANRHMAMILEYVPGTDLEHFLQHRRPSLASVLTVGADLASALAASRQQRLVHGDLKAGNVLITTSGRLKLTDFGIAHKAGPNTGLAGSASALSPEQLRGESMDVRSDLFCLGCLLYRMLAGQHPFMRNGQVDPRLLLEEDAPPLDSQLSPGDELPAGLAQLVDRLLQKDPADRPHNTHQVRQALRRIHSELPLGRGGSLQEQSADLFRPELPEDLPPRVPEDLRQQGRSRLQASAADLRWSWRNPSARPRMMALAAALLVAVSALATLAGQWWWRAPARVHVTPPLLQIAAQNALPAVLSRDWLVAQLLAEVGERLGPMYVTGTVGATEDPFVYAAGRSPADRPVQQWFEVSLRCGAEFCLLDLGRWHGERYYSSQAVLAVAESEQRWRALLGSAARQLFDQPGVIAGDSPGLRMPPLPAATAAD